MTMLSNRFGLVVVLSALALVGCSSSGKPAKSPTSSSAGESSSGQAEIGKQAPELTLQTLNGKGTVSLEALKGKAVIVDFWATWCAPCKQSFPKLEELSKKLGDTAEVIGVSVDDEVKGVADFAKANGATFAIGWDEGHSIADRWGNIGTMPTTFVIDTTGKVRHIHSGYHDGETDVMAKEVAAILDEAGSGSKVAKTESSETKEEPPTDAAAATDDENDDGQKAEAEPPVKKAGKGKKNQRKAPKKGGKKK